LETANREERNGSKQSNELRNKNCPMGRRDGEFTFAKF
jgi:hypothetical protein